MANLLNPGRHEAGGFLGFAFELQVQLTQDSQRWENCNYTLLAKARVHLEYAGPGNDEDWRVGNIGNPEDANLTEWPLFAKGHEGGQPGRPLPPPDSEGYRLDADFHQGYPTPGVRGNWWPLPGNLVAFWDFPSVSPVPASARIEYNFKYIVTGTDGTVATRRFAVLLRKNDGVDGDRSRISALLGFPAVASARVL